MQWPIPQTSRIHPSVSPIKVRYIVAIFLICCIPAIWRIWAVWGNQNWQKIGLTAAMPFFACGLLLAGRKIHAAFKKRAQLRSSQESFAVWQEWAQRGIALVGSHYVLPSEMPTDGAIAVQQNNMGRSFAFDAGFKEEIETVIQSFIQALTDIAVQSHTDKVTVFLDLTGDFEKIESVRKAFKWPLWDAREASKIQIDLVDTKLYADTIDSWIEDGMCDNLYALFSYAQNTDEANTPFTENLTWLIFAKPLWAQHNQLPIAAVIERPVDVDVTQKESALSALHLFKQYGLAGRKADSLWSGVSKEQSPVLHRLLSQAGVYTTQYDETPELKMLVHPLGIVPPNMPWLTLAWAVDDLHDSGQCVAWEKQNGQIGVFWLRKGYSHSNLA